jgi:hypothetical protein
LLPAPSHALIEYDQYALGAHTLRDLLAITDKHLPGFLWSLGLEGITDALNAARKSDPRNDTDPVLVVARRGVPESDSAHATDTQENSSE